MLFWNEAVLHIHTWELPGTDTGVWALTEIGAFLKVDTSTVINVLEHPPDGFTTT